MAVKNMTLEEFLDFLKEKQGDIPSSQFAQSLGISPQKLCDVYGGRRPPSDTITSSLNVQRNTVYTVDITNADEDKNES
jgi:predicted chitinase